MLLLRKGVYRDECMDNQEKFNKTLLPEKKKDFYNHLNMGDNTDSDDADTNRTRIKRFQE